MAARCSSPVGRFPSGSVLMYEAARDTPHRMIARGPSGMIPLIKRSVGTWRSLVAHSAGGRVVAGSNPAVPTPRASTLSVERPENFGHTLSPTRHHRVYGPDRGRLLRRVRDPGLPVGPTRGRCLG